MLPQQEIPQAHSPPHILVSYANGIIRSTSSRNTPQAHIRTLCKTFSSTLTAAQPLQPAHSRTQIQYDVSHLTAPSDTPRTPPSVSSKVSPAIRNRAATAALRRLCSGLRPCHWRAIVSRFSMVSPALCVPRALCYFLSKGLSQQMINREQRKTKLSASDFQSKISRKAIQAPRVYSPRSQIMNIAK